MFATDLETDNTANIFLAPAGQKVFCKMDGKRSFTFRLQRSGKT